MLDALLLACLMQDPAAPAPDAAAAPSPPRLAAVERLIHAVPEAYPVESLQLAFAPDGARAAFVAQLPDGSAVIIADGVASEPHQFARAPRFSADGKHLAWVWGDRRAKDREEWELMLDGKRVKKADWIGQLSFAPVGEDYAVWTGKDVRWDEQEGYEGGEYTCWWGKKKADGYTGQAWQDPQWSADGRHLGFIAVKPSRMMAVVDGKEFGPYNFASGFTWSADGKSAAWAALEGFERTQIFVGKKVFGDEYESVGAPALGPDGALAYLVSMRGRRALVFRDAVVPGYYDDLGTPAVSPDGKRVVVAANNGRKDAEGGWFVDNSWMDGALFWGEDEAANAAAGSACFLVLDGAKLGGDWARVIRPQFSPDSRHVAARARSAEGWQVLLDGGASPVYDEVETPRFSADGKHLEFGARRGRELLWVRLAVE